MKVIFAKDASPLTVLKTYAQGWVLISDKGDNWDDYRSGKVEVLGNLSQELETLEDALVEAEDSQLVRTKSYESLKVGMKKPDIVKLKETLKIADKKIESLMAANRAMKQQWTHYVHRGEMQRQVEEAVRQEKQKHVRSPGGSADVINIDKHQKKALLAKWSENQSVAMSSDDLKWWMLSDFGVNDADTPSTPSQEEENESQVVPVMNTGGFAPRNAKDDDEEYMEKEVVVDTSDPSDVLLLHPKEDDTDAIKKDIAEQNYNVAIQFEDKTHGGLLDGRRMSVPRRIQFLDEMEKDGNNIYQKKAEKFADVIKNLTENITKFKALVEVYEVRNQAGGVEVTDGIMDKEYLDSHDYENPTENEMLDLYRSVLHAYNNLWNGANTIVEVSNEIRRLHDLHDSLWDVKTEDNAPAYKDQP